MPSCPGIVSKFQSAKQNCAGIGIWNWEPNKIKVLPAQVRYMIYDGSQLRCDLLNSNSPCCWNIISPRTICTTSRGFRRDISTNSSKVRGRSCTAKCRSMIALP